MYSAFLPAALLLMFSVQRAEGAVKGLPSQYVECGYLQCSILESYCDGAIKECIPCTRDCSPVETLSPKARDACDIICGGFYDVKNREQSAAEKAVEEYKKSDIVACGSIESNSDTTGCSFWMSIAITFIALCVFGAAVIVFLLYKQRKRYIRRRIKRRTAHQELAAETEMVPLSLRAGTQETIPISPTVTSWIEGREPPTLIYHSQDTNQSLPGDALCLNGTSILSPHHAKIGVEPHIAYSATSSETDVKSLADQTKMGELSSDVCSGNSCTQKTSNGVSVDSGMIPTMS